MSEATWWRHLRGDPTRFLLDDQEPGVVWRALTTLLERPPDSPAVVRARLAARETGTAAGLLAEQNPLGYWGSPVAYGARWGGTAWHVIALAALGADPEDPRAERAAEKLLESLQPRSGGFSAARGRPPSACFTAEVCAALARFGFAHHPRVREAVAWFAERDGGAGGWSCPELRHLLGGACPIACVAALRFLAELAPAERAPLASVAERAAGFLLGAGLWVDGSGPRGWWTFAHPNLGRTDLLDALFLLARSGRRADPAVLRALLGVLARQDGSGRWLQQQAAPFGEPVGEPSRWVTLKALVSVAAYGDALAVHRGDDACGG
ncbi:MAG: terpene cyclase/mutase family protein [Thermoanaerobaculaceae bacterium]|nr:terpene cyclase/mutase family protein [Thermoanaerobaculaceae bacterium]